HLVVGEFPAAWARPPEGEEGVSCSARRRRACAQRRERTSTIDACPGPGPWRPWTRWWSRAAWNTGRRVPRRLSCGRPTEQSEERRKAPGWTARKPNAGKHSVAPPK